MPFFNTSWAGKIFFFVSSLSSKILNLNSFSFICKWFYTSFCTFFKVRFFLGEGNFFEIL